jgi:hypothetical protein
MARTESNKDLITDIEAGIKKELSVSLRIGGAICSICKMDQFQTMCKHWPGREYDGQTCHMQLTDPKDAYEVSFVAVPAQADAGVIKEFQKAEDSPTEEQQQETKSNKDLEVKLKLQRSFLLLKNKKEND